MSESFKKIEPKEDPRENLEEKVVSSYTFIDDVFRILELYVGYFFATGASMIGFDFSQSNDPEDKEEEIQGD